MTTRNAVLLCALVTLLLCLLWVPRLRLTVALADPAVRSKANDAIRMLRHDGIWLVNTDLTAIERNKNSVCFFWKHQYRLRTDVSPAESFTTCL
ncbi:MAG: hypothetical protein V1926_06025 [Candidatus Peregrinibacteria bacterium]